MNLVKIKDGLYVPEDFAKHHHYFADAGGEKEYTGISRVLGVLAKPALIGWAARMACEYIWQNAEKFSIETDNPVTQLITEKYADQNYRLVSQQTVEEAKNAHTKKKEAAGEHGTDLHAGVEWIINLWLKEYAGKPTPLTTSGATANFMVGSLEPFINWASDNVDHFLFAERRMFNEDMWLAGTADFAYIGKDGKKMMGDFKTSSGVYGIDYFLQCAGYRILAEGEGDAPYDGSTIVRLGKKGPADFDVHYRYDWETDREAFMACLTIYRAQATFKK